MKKCNRCSVEKDFTDFRAISNKINTFTSICITCDREVKRARYAANPGPAKAAAKGYYQAHREAQVAAQKAYRTTNSAALKAYQKTWKINNPVDRIKNRLQSSVWAKNHPDNKTAARQRRRAAIALSVGSFTPVEWRDLKVLYSNTCLRCGEVEPYIKLTADHVIPLSKGGANTIDNIQPLCGPCNGSKATKSTDYRVDKQPGGYDIAA